MKPVWQQILCDNTAKREDIKDIAEVNIGTSKKLLDLLTGEEKNRGSDYSYIKATQSQKEVKSKNKKGKEFFEDYLKKYEKSLHKINDVKRLNKNLKENVDDITRMNALYVFKSGGKYLGDPKMPTLPKLEETRPSNNKEITNFRYISESYRTQLMRAFLNFNPLIHLNNITNLLSKADPEIEKDIKALWTNIEKDLKEVLDQKYYTKKFDKVKKQFIKENNEGKHTKTAKSKSNNKKSNNEMPNDYTGESTKTQDVAEKKKSEVEKLKEYMENIVKSIDKEAIEHYINDNNKLLEKSLEEQYGFYFSSIKDAGAKLSIMQREKLRLDSGIKSNISRSSSNSNEPMLQYIMKTQKELLQKLFEKDEPKSKNILTSSNVSSQNVFKLKHKPSKML